MFVEKDYRGRTETKYMCDRCKTDLTTDTRRAICVQEPRTTTRKKKWDLCPRCYKLLCRGIEKGVKQEG